MLSAGTSEGVEMKRIPGTVAWAAVLLGSVIGAHAASPPAEAGHYERVTVHGKSLEGNLDGDSADRPVSIYLPPGYGKDPKRSFPVIYLLHGFTDSDSNWFGRSGQHFVNVPKAADAAWAAGVSESILVMPNAFTKYQGSMYSNSAAVGDWETFVARELVAWVDDAARVIDDLRSGHNPLDEGGLATLLASPDQRELFGRIGGMMSLLEGHGDVTMDRAGFDAQPHGAVAGDGDEHFRAVDDAVRHGGGAGRIIRQRAPDAGDLRDEHETAGGGHALQQVAPADVDDLSLGMGVELGHGQAPRAAARTAAWMR